MKSSITYGGPVFQGAAGGGGGGGGGTGGGGGRGGLRGGTNAPPGPLFG